MNTLIHNRKASLNMEANKHVIQESSPLFHASMNKINYVLLRNFIQLNPGYFFPFPNRYEKERFQSVSYVTLPLLPKNK